MEVVVNGQQLQIKNNLTIKDLIDQLKLDGRPIAVELNHKIVSKKDHDSARLKNGDKLEIVTFVGGG